MKLYEECKYNADDVEKILNFSSWSEKKKVDTLFHIDCVMYCNLGTDSSSLERKEIYRKSKKIYRAIRQFNPSLGKMLLGNMD